MAKARTKVDMDALLVTIDESVRKHGALSRKDMAPLKRHLPELAPRLAERGYEVGSTIRRPLESQILELANRGFVLMKGLERRVSGATASEVKAAAERLIEQRAMAWVLRESGVGMVSVSSEPAACEHIDRSELAELLRRLTQVQKLVRRAAAKKRPSFAVLRDDVADPLSRWLPSPARPLAAHTPQDPADSERLADEIRRRVVQSGLPVRVPELLRALGTTAEEGGRALFDGVARGWFDLEPESGMGRLSPEDAKLCPAGPMGTRLSWVVVRAQKGLDRL